MEREVGGGIGMGNTCKPMAVSFQCMTKSTTKKKKNFTVSIICALTSYSNYARNSKVLSIRDSLLWLDHTLGCC